MYLICFKFLYHTYLVTSFLPLPTTHTYQLIGKLPNNLHNELLMYLIEMTYLHQLAPTHHLCDIRQKD
jgi:hypothetical protein